MGGTRFIRFKKDQVTGLKVPGRNLWITVILGIRCSGDADANLTEDILRIAGAVKPPRRRSPKDIRHTYVLKGSGDQPSRCPAATIGTPAAYSISCILGIRFP